MADHKIDGNVDAGNVQAPERIWASNRTNGNCVVSFTSRSEEYSIEYIRADVAEAELAAMTALRDKPAPAVLPLLPDMVDTATAAGVVVWWDNEAQEIKMAVTVQDAARVLLDLLKTPLEKAPIEASHIEDVWTATFRKSGFAAVKGFLRAIAGGES